MNAICLLRWLPLLHTSNDFFKRLMLRNWTLSIFPATLSRFCLPIHFQKSLHSLRARGTPILRAMTVLYADFGVMIVLDMMGTESDFLWTC